nr:SDR family oxidoreductase [Leptospira ryugenii]
MGSFVWKDKVVWVTGASSGIGEALVKELAKLGARVVLSARNEKELKRVQLECSLDEGHSLLLPLDISDYKNLQKKVQTVQKKWSQIDVLINNAGVSQRDLAENTSIEVTEKIMDINFFGVVALSKAVYPLMKKNKSGILVVIASLAGKIGTPLRSSYCASKHAVLGFFDGWRGEAFHDGIQITTVCPGFVKTKISLNALVGDGKNQGKMDEGIENGLEADYTARVILAGIARGKDELIISGFKERFAYFLKRFFPRVLNRILRQAKVT